MKSRTSNGYTLKKGETPKSWLKALCDRLNKETDGITYNFSEYNMGFRIEVGTSNHLRNVSIVHRVPRWKTDGDIDAVSVKAEDISSFRYRKYETILPTLNRPFKVSPDGSVNIKKLHKCVSERVAAIEKYEKDQAESKNARDSHFERLAEALNGSGIEIEHYSDRSGFHLLHNDTSFNCTLSNDREIQFKLGSIYVPDEKIPDVIEALHKVTDIIKAPKTGS